MPERDVLTVRAHALASDGTGVARVDNLVVFVRGLLPGETACVRVTERRKKYWRAEVVGQLVNNTREGVLDNVAAQASRMAPLCPVFGRCGGCDLQHMSYEDTLFWKRRWVKDALVRIAKTDVDVREVIGMKDPWRYRNKAVLHWDGSSLGWFTANSHEVVEFDDCLLLSRGMNDMVRYLKPYLAVGAAEPSEVVLRQDAAGKVYWIKGSEAGGESESSRFDGSRIEVGESHLSIGFSTRVFMQVNTEQMDTLLRCVMAVADLREGDVVWDLYCGVGLLGLGLARCARAVVGVEENADAVSDASENARHNGIDNIEFVAGSVEGFLASDQA
ncbi:MAG: TRAM domain-containing protein, partial [Gracilibacteraceae bacterium]|nr:TRAM domain-containing protein [Gracilibacteraceae bacterium]